MLCLCSLSNIAACYTGSETTLSWSPIRLSILHWQPEFHKLVASGWLTISGHNNYTNNNFDFQPNWLKWHSKLPANWSLFTFPLLLKYKTNFPVIIFLTQHFTAMISAKLCRHGFSAISHNKRIVGARGHICSFAKYLFRQSGIQRCNVLKSYCKLIITKWRRNTHKGAAYPWIHLCLEIAKT